MADKSPPIQSENGNTDCGFHIIIFAPFSKELSLKLYMKALLKYTAIQALWKLPTWNPDGVILYRGLILFADTIIKFFQVLVLH